ncbi:type I methionyl aminopeptidase [Paenibacillus soyae]|uniref:Methionine aminopeptidase n=1 Tax=Paenibacillus soyae TaxID=2969249 RepID=A0A9X2MR48_9BACL|nr:type I methionyl aminopeptidase [Paenibacillus soyae]MCR2804850.1 type I methionyl aminopeptidase [Paenibacillus soyae]
MTIGSVADIEGLKEIGKIVAVTIEKMKAYAEAGMTTRELDEYGGSVLESFGAVSAPKRDFHFPGHSCISVGRSIAHGIPGMYKLQEGDLLNIDVCAAKNGYIADSGSSFQLPPYDETVTELCRYTHQAMLNIIDSLRDGTKLNEIGRQMELEAKRGGYRVIRNLCSHGVGRAIHEEPNILPYYDKRDRRVLREGMVITVEPFFSTGADYADEQRDGWSLRLPRGSMAVQYEHTIIITKDKPIIVTVA